MKYKTDCNIECDADVFMVYKNYPINNGKYGFFWYFLYLPIWALGVYVISFGLPAFLPMPKGRGFSRSLLKDLGHWEVLPVFPFGIGAALIGYLGYAGCR